MVGKLWTLAYIVPTEENFIWSIRKLTFSKCKSEIMTIYCQIWAKIYSYFGLDSF